MKIKSNNEWEKLRSVVLGTFFNQFDFPIDISFKYFFKDFMTTLPQGDIIPIKQKYIEELNEDIEEFKNALEKLNVKVYRPQDITKVHKIKTPYWETNFLPPLNVRDQTLILNDTIIETSVMRRNRYFENDLLKNIFYEAFLDGAKWIKMPTPTLLDKSFDFDNIQFKENKQQLYFQEKQDINELVNSDISNFSKMLNQYEMMIDAAQFVRFGKDIIVNISNKNHYLGYLWFKRQFSEYKFHTLVSLTDNHLDSFIVPLKKGVLLLRDKKYKDILPNFLKEWKIIYPPKPKENWYPVYKKDDPILTTLYIDINVLSIDGYNIICNSLSPEFCEFLSKEGFNPIPVRHRHRRIFGGGFHCFTLDLWREE